MIEIEFEKNKRVVLIIVKQGPKRTRNMKDVIIFYFLQKQRCLAALAQTREQGT